ncbi:DNA adenine methylase [bacterium]|nr:DNA adenine methylase [bacterium]
MRYIGGKTKILPFLEEIITGEVKKAESFCDLFAGTGCVGRYFKPKFRIISNDLMYFSYLLNFSSVGLNKAQEFENLGFNPFEYLNNKELPDVLSEGFFEKEYSEKSGRMYFTLQNARKIDFVRAQIEVWKNEGRINSEEYLYLLGCLVESVPFVSNISGTFGAYNKIWDRRAKKDFVLREITPVSNNKKNKCFNKDANELIKEVEGDILYLDPPYNTRQYISNYHILETLAKQDNPEITGKTGLRVNSEGQKSDFCRKRTAPKKLKDIIENAKFEHIFLSYNTEGIIPLEVIEEIFSRYKNYKKFEIPYKTFKSNSRTKDRDLKELIFYAKK